MPRLLGMKVVCSVDGTDWQRGKWGKFARWYLRGSERLAAWFCNGLIADSHAVLRYYLETHRANSFLVTYGMRESKCEGIEWLERFGLKSREYILFVGRLVPENNIHHLISAFERTKTDKKLVIVGDDPWEKKYVGLLRRQPKIREWCLLEASTGTVTSNCRETPTCLLCPTKSAERTRLWSRRWGLAIAFW